MARRKCLWCGKDITHRHGKAKFCSDLCRVRYWRFQKNSTKTENVNNVDTISNQLEQYATLQSQIITANTEIMRLFLAIMSFA
jgi:sigma54-dependent transcription regulator